MKCGTNEGDESCCHQQVAISSQKKANQKSCWINQPRELRALLGTALPDIHPFLTASLTSSHVSLGKLLPFQQLLEKEAAGCVQSHPNNPHLFWG